MEEPNDCNPIVTRQRFGKDFSEKNVTASALNKNWNLDGLEDETFSQWSLLINVC